MKNTRKKMLLSSVAMLLVALVALGSATYAWFSVNTTVTANTMQVTASAPKGLQITGSNGAEGDDATDPNWGAKVDFNLDNTQVGAVSVPYSSSALGNIGYFPGTVKNAADAANGILDTNYDNFEGWGSVAIATDLALMPTTKTTTPSITKAQVKGDYFVAYEVGIRATDDDTAAKTIQCTADLVVPSGSDIRNDYIRAAIIEGDSTAIATGTLKEVIANGAERVNAISDITNASSIGKTAVTTSASGSTFTFHLPNQGTSAEPVYQKNKATWFTIVLWVEGQDAQCFDANPSLTGQFKLTFEALNS